MDISRTASVQIESAITVGELRGWLYTLPALAEVTISHHLGDRNDHPHYSIRANWTDQATDNY